MKNEASRAKARNFLKRNTERPLIIRTLKGAIFWPRTYKGQSIIMYMVLIGAIAAAFVGMRLFLTRAVQEKYRQSADLWGKGEQYEKGSAPGEVSGSTFTVPTEKCAAAQSRYRAIKDKIKVCQQAITRLDQEARDLEDRANRFENEYNVRVDEEAQRLEGSGFSGEAGQLRQNIQPALQEEAAKARLELAKQRRTKSAEYSAEKSQLQADLNAVMSENEGCSFETSY